MKAALIFLFATTVIYAVVFVIIYKQSQQNKNQITRHDTGEHYIFKDQDGKTINTVKK